MSCKGRSYIRSVPSKGTQQLTTSDDIGSELLINILSCLVKNLKVHRHVKDTTREVVLRSWDESG